MDQSEEQEAWSGEDDLPGRAWQLTPQMSSSCLVEEQGVSLLLPQQHQLSIPLQSGVAGQRPDVGQGEVCHGELGEALQKA